MQRYCNLRIEVSVFCSTNVSTSLQSDREANTTYIQGEQKHCATLNAEKCEHIVTTNISISFYYYQHNQLQIKCKMPTL